MNVTAELEAAYLAFVADELPRSAKKAANDSGRWSEGLEEDLVQAAALKLWAALPGFDSRKGTFGQFAQTVISRAFPDALYAEVCTTGVGRKQLGIVRKAVALDGLESLGTEELAAWNSGHSLSYEALQADAYGWQDADGDMPEGGWDAFYSESDREGLPELPEGVSSDLEAPEAPADDIDWEFNTFPVETLREQEARQEQVRVCKKQGTRSWQSFDSWYAGNYGHRNEAALPKREVDQNAAAVTVSEIMPRLTDKQAIVLGLYYGVAGRPAVANQEEIAEILGVSQGSVSETLERAKIRAKKIAEQAPKSDTPAEVVVVAGGFVGSRPAA